MRIDGLAYSAASILCALKRRRRIRPAADSHGLVKVNLGCGLAVARGWTNVDASLNAFVSGWPRALHRLLYRASGANRRYTADEYCDLLATRDFIHHDLSYGIPFPNACADYVYSSHLLEHLHLESARRLLRDCLRVLKKGGVLRLCVPDLERAMSLYSQGRKREMLQTYFFVDESRNAFSVHKYMYDFGLLKEELEGAGFSDVTRRAFGEGEMPDVAMLDNHPDETLFVEAKKP